MNSPEAENDPNGSAAVPPSGSRQCAAPNDLTLGYKILRAAFTLASMKSLHMRSVALDQADVGLDDEGLWNEFNSVSNEMIITKLGRCLFPTIKITLHNLNPTLLYAIGIDFVMVGNAKYKFKGPRRGWVDATTNQPSEKIDAELCERLRKIPITELYEYAESPKRGEYWNRNMISFSKLKLTNKFQSPHKFNRYDGAQPIGNNTAEHSILFNAEGIFSLYSFHRYIPRIHILHVPSEYSRRTVKRPIHAIKTFVFPQTAFIAVTHYQNNAVNLLKKNYNPHAKGFKDSYYSGSSSSQHSLPSSLKIIKEVGNKHFKGPNSDSEYFSSDECE